MAVAASMRLRAAAGQRARAVQDGHARGSDGRPPAARRRAALLLRGWLTFLAAPAATEQFGLAIFRGVPWQNSGETPRGVTQGPNIQRGSWRTC